MTTNSGYQDFGIPPQGEQTRPIFATSFDIGIAEVDVASGTVTYDNTNSNTSLGEAGSGSCKLVTGAVLGNQAGILRRTKYPVLPIYDNAHITDSSYYKSAYQYQTLSFALRSSPANASGLQTFQAIVNNVQTLAIQAYAYKQSYGIQLQRTDAGANAETFVKLLHPGGTWDWAATIIPGHIGQVLLSAADAAGQAYWHIIKLRVDVLNLKYFSVEIDGIVYTLYQDLVAQDADNEEVNYSKLDLHLQTDAASAATAWIDDLSFLIE